MKHGQITLVGLFFTFINIVMVVAMQGTLQQVINAALPSADTLTKTVLGFFIPMLYLGVVIGYFAYAAPGTPLGGR